MDPRIQRTRSSLQDALLTICKKRDLDDVSISEIAEAAGVNRTTFYQHYPDIDTLLADALDAIAVEASAQLELDLPSASAAEPRDIIHKYLEHVHENASLYRRVLNSSGSPVTVDRLTARVAAIAEAGMRQAETSEAQIPVTVAAASMAGAFVGVVRAWLRQRPLPSADTATEWAMIALAIDEQTLASRIQ
jgi:AcrR family transcriptional regulator